MRQGRGQTTRRGATARRRQGTGNPLARLDKAEQSAQAQQEARDEAASEQRQTLIASWNLHGRVPEHLATAPDADIDAQILVMAREVLYQYERQHGPVRALLPAPDLTAEQWAARTDAEVAGYAKGVLLEGVTPEWKRPREWLLPDRINGPQEAEERQ